jgi:DNA sulfur modification protein DndD
MWIERLQISNYRQYRDVTIDFPDPRKSVVTVIQGPNGAGKTNLLNALSWCLYGEELHLDKKNLGLPIYHAGLLETLHVGQTDKVEVEMTLQLNSGARVVITRSLPFRCVAKGKLEPLTDPSSLAADGSRCSVAKQVGGDMKPVPEAGNLIGKLLPKAIEGYFFFDGERLKRYFEETSDQDIQASVLNISQVDLLKRLIAHLQKEESGFRKDEKGLSPQAKEAEKQLQSHKELLNRLQLELDELRENKSKVEKGERDAIDKLRAVAPDNIDKLQDEREGLEADVKHLTEELTGFEGSTFQTSLEIIPILLGTPQLEEFAKLLDASTEAGEIPPAYRKSFLERLLKKGVCICGRSLEKGSDHYRAIEQLAHTSSSLSEISVELIRQLAVINDLEDECRKSGVRLDELTRNIKATQDQLTLKNARLKEVTDLIGSSDIDQVRVLEDQIRQFKETKDRLQTSTGAKGLQIETETASVADAQKRLNDELVKEKGHDELLAILNFCQTAIAAAEETMKQITAEMRQEIQKRTQEYFLSLIWKRETYRGVKIDEDYNVSVEHQSGLDSIGTLSAGEQQVLALSFVSALTNVSGFDAPLVIDTPLARISGAPRQAVASNLPRYLDKKQIVLLMTEEEYTASVRDAMRTSVGREWQIVFSETASGSEASVVAYGKTGAT